MADIGKPQRIIRPMREPAPSKTEPKRPPVKKPVPEREPAKR